MIQTPASVVEILLVIHKNPKTEGGKRQPQRGDSKVYFPKF